eukprot:GILI01019536.1.p1 GENE.GILI01019536.1~~GILI01019536.1.p1  ORF type:complete len:253 (+),score=17.05 GILI01019536.1:102-761(+)
MIQQFCLESTSAEQQRTKELAGDLPKTLSNTTRVRGVTQHAPKKENDYMLSNMRSQGAELLEGGVLTPANIRHFVRNMQVSKSSAVIVQTNAVTQQKTINGRDAGVVEREERHRAHWAVSQKKTASRLDAVVVSKPSPPPKLYKYSPQLSRPFEANRYSKVQNNPLLLEPAPINQASFQRPGPLSPMMLIKQDSGAPLLTAMKAPRSTIAKLPRIAQPE